MSVEVGPGRAVQKDAQDQVLGPHVGRLLGRDELGVIEGYEGPPALTLCHLLSDEDQGVWSRSGFLTGLEGDLRSLGPCGVPLYPQGYGRRGRALLDLCRTDLKGRRLSRIGRVDRVAAAGDDDGRDWQGPDARVSPTALRRLSV